MTRSIASLFATTATIGMMGSAFGAAMTDAEIKTFLSGMTAYLETTAASTSGKAGQAVIYFAEDGKALYKTPSGDVWHGTWTTKNDQLCADWKEKPNNACLKYDKEGDLITVHDANSGELRATVVETAHGNAENIAP